MKWSMAFTVDNLSILRPELTDSETENRRRLGRAIIRGVGCDAGKVMDMSRTGARLVRRGAWKPGESRLIAMSASGLCMRVEAECVWCRKIGFMRYAVGVRFIGQTKESERAVVEIMRVCSRDESLTKYRGTERSGRVLYEKLRLKAPPMGPDPDDGGDSHAVGEDESSADAA